jgi:hypothetical protein
MVETVLIVVHATAAHKYIMQVRSELVIADIGKRYRGEHGRVQAN